MPENDDALDEVAVALCAVVPGAFMAERTARAAAEDPALAKRIKTLRKPVVSAWAVDRMARTGALTEALALAAELREAAADLDAAELSRLSAQRRALVAGLAKQAAAGASVDGVSVSAAALEDIERTIDAAVRDPGAAAAVMSARLVKPLQASGIEELDAATLAEALSGSVPMSAPQVPVAPADELADRRARKAAEKALRDAERDAASAERAHGQARSRATTAHERHDRLAERVRDLRAELDRIETDLTAAADDVAERDAAVSAAAETLQTASDAVDTARRALE